MTESTMKPRPEGPVAALRGRPQLLRAQSELGSRGQSPRDNELVRSNEDIQSTSVAESDWVIRHGFEYQLLGQEDINLLSENFFMYFTDKKHETGGNPREEDWGFDPQEWRSKDRLKTVAAVLVMCINIGVDPPDIVKTHPSAKLECWIDPTAPTSTHGVINQIGRALQNQYEQLSMRTRYRQVLDPTLDDIRKHCQTLRRSARNERVLFHYNGHGVPRPTASGEIWGFNKNFTQYIPLSLYDLHSFIGGPALFVWDVADAGQVIRNYQSSVLKYENDMKEARQREPHGEFMENTTDCIHLGACEAKETIPTNPDCPADLFTCCLTTPIEMSLRFFVLQNPLACNVTLADVANLPGRVSERRTPHGELNWIFTAITDTIAWNTLEPTLFKKLFRQDLMVAALFRNYLLAQRVMRTFGVTPVCHPMIPSTHDHPLWRSWDFTIEMIIAQLPDMLAGQRENQDYDYQHSEFFAEQLTAFEVYLTQGALIREQPPQLPIVLQVLLSQVHRLRALIALSKFLDLGPWAVNLALSIGIFPYVLKLLQSQAIELKAVMIFIWARILAVDQSCQGDLLKDSGYQYFISALQPQSGIVIPKENASEHRAMCAFIISMFCNNYHQAQVACMSTLHIIDCLLTHLEDMENPLLRQWGCLCISKLWVDYPEAKWAGIRANAHQKLCDMVVDPVAEVRAAMLHALTTFLRTGDITDQAIQIEESIASMLLIVSQDGNSMVRRELLVFFSTFVARYLNRMRVAAFEHIEEEYETLFPESPPDSPIDHSDGLFMKSTNGNVEHDSDDSDEMLPDVPLSQDSIYEAIWARLLILSVDPHDEVSRDAGIIVDYVLDALLDSPLGEEAEDMIEDIIEHEQEERALEEMMAQENNKPPATHSLPLHPAPPRAPTAPLQPTTNNTAVDEGYFSAGIKRTASVAASLVNLVGYGGSYDGTPSETAPTPSLQRAQTHTERYSAARARIPDAWQAVADPVVSPPITSRKAKIPLPRHFRPRNEDSEINGPPFPLQSHFFDWSIEYFREPQMKPSEADEPGSIDYNQRLWRRNRNDKIIAKTQPQKEMAGKNGWHKVRAMISNGAQPQKMCFHQFEDHLAVCDSRDGVRIWDWRRNHCLNRFSNGNPAGSKMTEVRLINEDDTALLMTGSSDGVIKLWRNYEVPVREAEGGVELVTAFRALNELVPTDKINPGLVFDWQQSRGLILVAGDVKVIRVWNAGTEICTADIRARSSSPITALTSDQVEGNMFAAGFGDGAIRIYDQRLDSLKAMVMSWKEDNQWITNVHLQRGGQRELVSGCRSGEVRVWDMRMERSLKTVKSTREVLTAMSVHEHAPVFVVGTQRNTVKLFNIATSAVLSTFEPSAGPHVFQARNGPIASTAFHPHRMMVAGAASHGGMVQIMECKIGRIPGSEFEPRDIVRAWED